jgi:hypothetical protein
MVQQSTFDITTQIGCSVNCLKYCPQEIIISRYKGERHLSLDAFKQFISTVPKNTIIEFSGFAEPFLNQECPDMILWAHKKGHEIIIYSTLVGLTPSEADRILHIPFKEFVLHLPDAEGNANIPNTVRYRTVLGEVLTRVHNISFMNMGYGFTTVHCEDMARGINLKRRTGRVYCPFFMNGATNYQVLPNGDVFFCCMTRGLAGKVGSLYENTYEELIESQRYEKQVMELQTDPMSICHICSRVHPYWFSRIEKIKSYLFGDEDRLITILMKRLGIP